MSLDLELTFDGHRVRMAGTPERLEWVARDVCRVLYIHNAGDAVPKAGVTAEERGIARIYTPGGPQDLITVTEPGLWKLVMASRKPSAQRFKHWLATEVIPSVRKHGCFPPPPAPALPPPVDLRDPLQLAAITAQALQLVADLQPKAEAHDRLMAAHGDVCLQDAGRILGRQPNVFVATLLDAGVLFRGAHGKPEPRHDLRERGFFRVRVSNVNGQTYIQTLVSPRGLAWLASQYPATDRQQALDACRTVLTPSPSSPGALSN